MKGPGDCGWLREGDRLRKTHMYHTGRFLLPLAFSRFSIVRNVAFLLARRTVYMCDYHALMADFGLWPKEENGRRVFVDLLDLLGEQEGDCEDDE